MKLNPLTKWVFAVSAAALVAVSSATAGTVAYKEAAPEPVAEQWWNAELATGWDSKYLFRGVNVFRNAHNLHPEGENGSLHWTDFSLSAHGFTVGAWFANGISDDYNELNAYASYAIPLGAVDVSLGYIYYLLPKTDDLDTHEVFIKLSTSTTPFVTPSLAFYYDVDEIDGGYLEFALTSSIPVVPDVVSIDPFAAISYSFEYNSSSNDFNHVEAGVRVPVSLSKNVTLSGYIKHSWALDAIEAFQGDEWVGGVAVALSF